MFLPRGHTLAEEEQKKNMESFSVEEKHIIAQKSISVEKQVSKVLKAPLSACQTTVLRIVSEFCGLLCDK